LEGGKLLPRGKFLFIGGDTSYHIADYPTLVRRVQSPFWWAYRDLNPGVLDKQLLDDPRRPIFGIPGNHDYYDALDGFNRQFRRPCSEECQPNSEKDLPQLSIPSFKRIQQGSYVALKLPFNW
jgi:hypothetical protein